MFDWNDLNVSESYRVDVEKRDDPLTFIDHMRIHLARRDAAENATLMTSFFHDISPKFLVVNQQMD